MIGSQVSPFTTINIKVNPKFYPTIAYLFTTKCLENEGALLSLHRHAIFSKYLPAKILMTPETAALFGAITLVPLNNNFSLFTTVFQIPTGKFSRSSFDFFLQNFCWSIFRHSWNLQVGIVRGYWSLQRPLQTRVVQLFFVILTWLFIVFSLVYVFWLKTFVSQI